MSLHDLLNELDGALGHVRDAIGHDLGPIDQILGKLRTHADEEAAALEQAAIADAKQVGSDVEAAAGPVVQEVEKDAADLEQTAVAGVESALGSAAVPSTPDQAPAAPSEPTTPAETPAPAEAAAPSEPAADAATQA